MNAQSHIDPTAKIAPTARLIGRVHIGARVVIHDYAVIGDSAEHIGRGTDSDSVLSIGEGTIIREHVVVQRGVLGHGDRDFGTRIGSNCYIMHGAHIAHDCVVGDNCVLSPYVVLGGHTWLQPFVTMGIHSATHQNTTIGFAVMVGMGAMVVKDVPPTAKVAGVPAKWIGVNQKGLDRAQLTQEQLDTLRAVFHSVSCREILPC